MTLSLNKNIPIVDHRRRNSPQDYVVYDPALVAATDTALALGKPLLLTGDPGIGKSVYAAWVAQELNSHYLRFVVKSNTESSDLFYQFDTLARFRDSRNEDSNNADDSQSSSLLKYVSYNALGLATLNSMGRQKAEEQGFIDEKFNASMYGAISDAPARSVVLIDEIDKAPRDVPNDMLDEIDRNVFRVRELDNKEAQADPARRPVVVITSNSERDLPRPFLRRCIYYHMHLPSDNSAGSGMTQTGREVLEQIAGRARWRCLP